MFWLKSEIMKFDYGRVMTVLGKALILSSKNKKKKTYPIRDPRKWIIKMPMKGVVLLGIWNCCVLMLFDIDTMLQPGNVNLVFS